MEAPILPEDEVVKHETTPSKDIVQVMRTNERQQQQQWFVAQQQQQQLMTAVHSNHSPYFVHRRSLVQMIIATCEAFELWNQTTFCACALLDRIFESNQMNRDNRSSDFPLFAMV